MGHQHAITKSEDNQKRVGKNLQNKIHKIENLQLIIKEISLVTSPYPSVMPPQLSLLTLKLHQT